MTLRDEFTTLYGVDIEQVYYHLEPRDSGCFGRRGLGSNSRQILGKIHLLVSLIWALEVEHRIPAFVFSGDGQ